MAKTHGMTDTKIYSIWRTMKSRCMTPSNPRYADYGARGITVCERWLKFENFYADMGDRPEGRTLDRIDNSKGYSPENCRWATYSEQASNRRPRPRCPAGHEYSPENTYVSKVGWRQCKTCITARNLQYRAEARARVAALTESTVRTTSSGGEARHAQDR